jgi:hypothetical protein
MSKLINKIKLLEVNQMKTLTDFKAELTKLKQLYHESLIKYNWNYTFTEEVIGVINFAMVCNHHQATKLIYDSEQGIIVKREIYNQDVLTFLELQKQLKGGN